MPEHFWTLQGADLSAGGAHRICVPQFGDEGTINYHLLLTCTPTTPIAAMALDQLFSEISSTANATKVNGVENVGAPLTQVQGLRDKLAPGHGYCRYLPEGNRPAGPIFEPAVADPNAKGACVAMWNNGTPVMGQEWDLALVQLVAALFQHTQEKVPLGVNECHFGVFLASGSAEFASGCFGNYDMAKHRNAEGIQTFSCPVGL